MDLRVLSAIIMSVADPLAGPSPLRDIVAPQFHQNNFVVEDFIKTNLGVKLDKGAWRSVRLSSLAADRHPQMTRSADWLSQRQAAP